MFILHKYPKFLTQRTLELLAGTVSVDVPAREVRGRLGQRYGGHVVRLEFVPVRNVVEKSRLQLDQDLTEDGGEAMLVSPVSH